MFDIGKIGESADQLAQAGAGIAKSVEASVNLQMEQNAFLGAIVLWGTDIPDSQEARSDIHDAAARAIQRYLSHYSQTRANAVAQSDG